MDKHSQELSGFCHSCSLIRPLDVIIFPYRWFSPDSKENKGQEITFRACSHKIPEQKEIRASAYDHSLAIDNMDISCHLKESPATRAFVEWKTVETSMEDGLLGRAAVSRDGSEHIRWGTSRDYLDNLHYGSLQEYTRKLRKASLIKELQEAASLEGSEQEFFEGMSSNHSLEIPDVRSLKNQSFDSDLKMVTEGVTQTREIEACDEEEAIDASTSPESVRDERSSGGDDNQKNRSVLKDKTNFLPCQQNDVQEMVAQKKVQGRHRRGAHFPPPLTSLMRKTSSLLPHKIPRVLLQSIRTKERFVLQEVQIASQTVFQPIRQDGRLLLRLFRRGNQNNTQHGKPEESSHNLPVKLSRCLSDADDSAGQFTQSDYKEKHHSKTSIAQLLLNSVPRETCTEPVDGSSLSATQDAVRDCSCFSKLHETGPEHLGVSQTIKQLLFQIVQHNHDQDFPNEVIKSFAARALQLTLCRIALRNAEKQSTGDINPLTVKQEQIR